MKYKFSEIPRVFTVGSNDHISISDFGQIYLDPNEQVTFIMDDEFEYDVARKDWGFMLHLLLMADSSLEL